MRCWRLSRRTRAAPHGTGLLLCDFETLRKEVLSVKDAPGLWGYWLVDDNRAHPHPYQAAFPEEYRQEDRWFLLDTTLDPARPRNLGTPLPVFSLALTRGQAPHREWLVYAHAPSGEKKGVGVTIPGYKAFTLDVPVAGAFYQVSEATGGVEAVR